MLSSGGRLLVTPELKHPPVALVQCLTLSAKMAAVHEGTLRGENQDQTTVSLEKKCFPRVNSSQTKENVTYYYMFYVK